MIKPFYQDEWSTIFLGDCREILPQISKVALLLTDPPYGIGADSSMYKVARTKSGIACAEKHDYGETSWDTKIDQPLIKLITESSNNQIIWGGNYYADWLPASSCWLVWHKEINGNFADCELAWTSFKTAVRYFKWRWNRMLQEDMKHKEERVHPTQKPLPLMKWAIANYAKPGDVILDPFMGSGTTLVAAKALGFKSTGIEQREDYCLATIRRLSQTVMNFEQPKETAKQDALL